MADANVKSAQKYLNSMYGHRSEWVTLEEDGKTGTTTIRGIIRAFQIQNGVEVVGEAGPVTLQKFKSLSEISKMDPNDESDPNVCLIQCALFCKGYAAGGITGIYYTSGVNAVKQLQGDAGLPITGVIDWKVWSALLSFSWFTEPANPSIEWDPKIRTIQQQLNSSYADYLNVRACDGVMSRETALSLIGALQAEEGILSPDETITNLNELNFGEQTTALFPGPLTQGNNKTKFNLIAQYGLYFNGYDPGNFEGIYDSTMRAAVTNFQDFYALTGIVNDANGEIGYQTMMSLLVSRGDTARPAFACDCSTVLNSRQASDLVSAGYQVIGRYLTGTVGGTRSKALTKAEITRITNAGLRIFPIYQDGGYYLEYFKSSSRGSSDAITAIQTAIRLGFPYGTTIYFAVDFDCLPQDVDDYIVNYFTEINGIFSSTLNAEQYKIGVYGPRQLCAEMFSRMLAVSSFVSDMSRGFTGNCGYPLPINWSFDQFFEENFDSSPDFAIDKVALSTDLTKDKGCISFNQSDPITDAERINSFYMKYLRKFAAATTSVGNMFTYSYKFENERIHLTKFTDPTGRIEINTYLESSVTMMVHPESGSLLKIPINCNDDGSVSADFKAMVKNYLNELDKTGIIADYYDIAFNKCISIAEEMQTGSLALSIAQKDTNRCEIAVAWESNNLYLPSDGDENPEHNLTMRLAWVLEILVNSDYNMAVGEAISTVAIAAAILLGGWAVAEIGAVAGVSVGTVIAVSKEIGDILSVLLSTGLVATS